MSHRFPGQVGEDLCPITVTADADAAAALIGAAAHAHPQPFLLLGIAHRILAGNESQAFQSGAVGQGVGLIVGQRRFAPPPYAVIVKPDLLDNDLGGHPPGILRQRECQGEGLLRQAVKVVEPLHHPPGFLTGGRHKNQRRLHGYHQLVR